MEDFICANLRIITGEAVSQGALRTVLNRSGEARTYVILEKGACAIKHTSW